MRASLLLLAGLAVLSIAPANADPPRCNAMGWPRFSAVPCKNVLNFKNYADCADKVSAMGWTGTDIWLYCSNLGLKD
jgi:hypothetical protein